jgi:hypothetical protein
MLPPWGMSSRPNDGIANLLSNPSATKVGSHRKLDSAVALLHLQHTMSRPYRANGVGPHCVVSFG